jgi:toxin YoeB
LEFDTAALEDLAWWIEQDRNKALRIMSLIKDADATPSKESENRNRCDMN